MELCKLSSNASDEQCAAMLQAVGDALYAMGGKWKLRIIIALFNGNKRFNQLQRTITGISARVLSNELKDLEMNGFVKRNVDAVATPVTVDYQLTEYSNTLENVVRSLSKWGTMHRKNIKHQIGKK